MANSITKAPHNKVSSTLRSLGEAGGTIDHLDWIRGRGNAALLIQFIDQQRSLSKGDQPAFTLVHGLFVKPEAQIVRVRELNLERGWGIPDEAFLEAEKSIPKWPEDKLVVVTLVPYLDDEEMGRKGVERTFQELWDVAAKQQHANWRWVGYDKAGPDKLRLLKGIEHKPGLRWEVIDLGCQRNKKLMDVRNSKSSPHAGILAAAALHPNWVKSMDGDKVPYVFAPGYEVQVPDEEPWAYVPHLSFGRDYRRIQLFYFWSDSYRSVWAVPSFFRE